jgi:Zn-dependent M28 family amino/carboxypeptidase|tara:strand:+ start:11071 stop:11982 length:912 start_codon:yes stop_codon:yes gene_type:complete
MKKYITFILLFLACSSNEIEKKVPKFDSNRAYQYIIDQCDYGPRNPGSTGHEQFSNFLENFLSIISDKVIIQNFNYVEHITGENRAGKNIIAQFNIDSNERLLIGAHWDTRAVADEDPNPENRSIPILGANDGASGTAILMELANIFSKNNPPIGIDLVFFDAEDVGISGQPTTYAMGSEYFSKNLPIEKPDTAIIVDMVGDKYLKIPIERFSYQVNPELVKEIWNLADNLGLRAFEYSVGYDIYDDHVPLWENAQIPAIDIIDFDYPNLFYNHWHTQNDTPENCSPQSLHQVGTLLLNYVYD